MNEKQLNAQTISVYDSWQLQLDCQKQNMVNEYRSQLRNFAETIHRANNWLKTTAPNGNAVTVYCLHIVIVERERREKEKNWTDLN